MALYLIRHTKVNVKQGICYGQSDVDVTDTFTDEAQLIKSNISAISFDKIYSSPLQRCKKLSKFLFTQEIKYDKRLMELNFGEWELQEWDSINDPQFKKWMDNYVFEPCLNGESFLDLHNRVGSFLSELKQNPSKNIAIITHGGAIRSILAHIHSENLKDAFQREIKYGEIIKTNI